MKGDGEGRRESDKERENLTRMRRRSCATGFVFRFTTMTCIFVHFLVIYTRTQISNHDFFSSVRFTKFLFSPRFKMIFFCFISNKH